MKKLMRSMIVMVLLIPGISYAAGYHVAGTVAIVPNTSMSGAMSVRWNGGAPNGTFIDATAWAGGGSVSFSGFDGTDNFICYVHDTSPLFAEAVDIKNSLNNGGHLYVEVNSGTGECTDIKFGNHSYLQE